MKTKLSLILSGLLIGSGAIYAGGACCAAGASDKSGKKTETVTPIGMDVVETAMGSEQFSTLVAAIQAADLVETLQGAENITVFAPTNDAFAALPEGTVETLLLPENKAALVQVLTYHVLPVAVPSESVASGEVTTIEGSPVEIVVEDGTVTVGGAEVITTDIDASNGIIHVIDAVILPPDLEL